MKALHGQAAHVNVAMGHKDGKPLSKTCSQPDKVTSLEQNAVTLVIGSAQQHGIWKVLGECLHRSCRPDARGIGFCTITDPHHEQALNLSQNRKAYSVPCVKCGLWLLP